MDGAVLLERSLSLLHAPPAQQTLSYVDRGYVLNNLGMARWHQGDLEGACACYEESPALGRVCGDCILVSHILSNLSDLALMAGDLEHAAALSVEILTEIRQNQPTAAADILRVQMLIAWRYGHLSWAAALAQRGPDAGHGS